MATSRSKSSNIARAPMIAACRLVYIDRVLIDPCASTQVAEWRMPVVPMRPPHQAIARFAPRIFSRGYAVPLNPATSYDAALGTAVPPPPSPPVQRRSRGATPVSLQRYAIAAASEIARVSPRESFAVESLLEQMEHRSDRQLSIELPYESTSKPGRRVPLTSALSPPNEISRAIDDGVLLLCFVNNVGTGAERVSMCTGFAIPGGDAIRGRDSSSSGPLIISCSHTVRHC